MQKAIVIASENVATKVGGGIVDKVAPGDAVQKFAVSVLADKTTEGIIQDVKNKPAAKAPVNAAPVKKKVN